MKIKRMISIALTLVFVSVPVLTNPTNALATSEYNGTLPEELFTSAKEALRLMSYGQYGSALEALGFSADSAEDFKLFADANFTSLAEGVQTDVAVACLTDEYGWLLAIPLWEPDATDVDTFVLHTSDEVSFDRYTSSTWGFIEQLLTQSTDTIWYNSYESEPKLVVPDGQN